MTAAPPGRPRAAALLFRPFERFFALESASGILLLATAAAALAWANSPWAGSYFHLWELRFTLGAGELALTKSLHHWINDGLMAVFFFVVGLELKREVLDGELASPKRAALSVAAAIGGMLVPALLYALLNRGTAGSSGWGIPMATDIAFALGVIALLGSRVPTALKVFVTAVAIVDDLGAVLVIALFYTAKLSLGALLVALLLMGVLVLLNVLGVRRTWIFLIPGLVLWLAVLKSGVHATIAGVLLALTIPARVPEEVSPAEHLEHLLHPWVAFAIMPIFALANAGVALGGNLAATFAGTIPAGVMLGLVVGKPLGILLACRIAVSAGVAALPTGVDWRQLFGVGMLCGIGFTMSLFIATLAFDPTPALLDQAKIGVLAASLIAGLGGGLILARHARTM